MANLKSIVITGKTIDLKGDNGKSAYELAQDNGYQGTEQQFVNELAHTNTANTFSASQTFNQANTFNGNDVHNGLETFKNSYYAVTALSNTEITPTNGGLFTKTISANTTFTISNVTNGCGFGLLLNMGGNYTVTFPSSVKFSGGTAPTLPSSGLVFISFITVDNGANWLANVFYNVE